MTPCLPPLLPSKENEEFSHGPSLAHQPAAMRNQFLFDILLLALLVAVGSVLGRARERALANSDSVIWGTIRKGGSR
jgi:hypothetical protein